VSRELVAGAVVVGLLLVGGLLLVAKLEREPAVAPAASAPAAPEPQPESVPSVRPAAPPAAARPPEPAVPAQASDAPLPSDVRARRAALAPLGAEVERALAALDGRVLACKLARPELALQLETLERRVRIADVRVHARDPGEIPEGVQSPPAEDERAVACVRRALLDELLDAPSARPGRRWELVYVPGGR
jgi:hypothetical protein